MDSFTLQLTLGLFILSIVSGMLGLGVAFAAIPFLSFFYSDLVHQIQPLSLVLNGVTALFAVFGFAGSGGLEWRKAIVLAVVTTTCAPLGSWLAQGINQNAVWGCYFVAVCFLAWRLFRPLPTGVIQQRYSLVLLLAIPISCVSGLLGVGPGFMLMPTMILLGFEPKRAAGINALAVTPPSFSALIPHLATARIDPVMALPLIIAGAVGSYGGAHLSSRYLPGERIRQFFGVLIVVMTLVRLSTLIRTQI